MFTSLRSTSKDENFLTKNERVLLFWQVLDFMEMLEANFIQEIFILNFSLLVQIEYLYHWRKIEKMEPNSRDKFFLISSFNIKFKFKIEIFVGIL